jgi:hypothetical protein
MYTGDPLYCGNGLHSRECGRKLKMKSVSSNVGMQIKNLTLQEYLLAFHTLNKSDYKI